VFSVRDSGIGIPPETLSKLFKPFVQADTSTTRRFGGTGLGLSIVKKLAELMGGNIAVASEAGQGSEFALSVALPCAEELPVEDDDIGEALEGSLAGVRILVVDDSTMNLDVASRILSRAGATVQTAGNGQEAVDRLADDKTAHDIVLMDVQMPVLDGHDATRRIRTTLGLKQLPVIALTAGVTVGEKERAQSAGMNDVVGKPFDPMVLVRVIRRHLAFVPELQPVEAVPAAGQAPAAAAPPSDFWSRPIPHIDMVAARRGFVGDHQLFAKVLRNLIEEFSDLTGARIATPQDLAPLKARMHSLKGLAGTVGALQLAEAAAAAEQACKQPAGSDPAGTLADVVTAYKALRDAVASNCDACAALVASEAVLDDGVAADAITPEALTLLLGRLQQFDLSALEQFNELQPGLRQQLGREKFDQLRRMLDDLQFGDAALLIEEVVNH